MPRGNWLDVVTMIMKQVLDSIAVMYIKMENDEKIKVDAVEQIDYDENGVIDDEDDIGVIGCDNECK